MAKSTQDALVWLKKLESALAGKDTIFSIEIFSDKSFRINRHNGDLQILFDSEDINSMLSGIPDMDFNDLIYQDIDDMVGIIQELAEEKKAP